MSDSRFAGATWRKSNVSGDTGCVEVAYADGVIGIRDSKQDSGEPILTFTPHEWSAFIAGVHNGEFAIDQLKR